MKLLNKLTRFDRYECMMYLLCWLKYLHCYHKYTFTSSRYRTYFPLFFRFSLFIFFGKELNRKDIERLNICSYDFIGTTGDL